MPAPANILLIRLKSIGDVLLTLPAVAVIRENFPGAKITFLTSAENVPLLRGFSELDEVIALDRAALRSNNPGRVLAQFFGLLRRLRAGKFDLVVDFQGYGETGWLARFTGARQRWGTIYNVSRSWAYTRRVTRIAKTHPADGNLELLRQCGLTVGTPKNEFTLPADALAAARKYFADHQLDPNGRTLFLQPFTSSPQKNWPLENYISIAKSWRARGVQVIFGGGPSESDALEPARRAGFPVAAGASLLVSGGLMNLSTLVLGGDTGMSHMAVAMGKHVVMIMGSILPGNPHPFQHPEWSLTPPPGQAIATIPTGAAMECCVRAFAEIGNAQLDQRTS